MLMNENIVSSEWRYKEQIFKTMEYFRRVSEGWRDVKLIERSERKGRTEMCDRESEKREGISERRSGGRMGRERSEGRGRGRLAREEEGREVRMSVSENPRGPHFLLRMAMVVAMVVMVLVVPLHATPSKSPHNIRPHHLPHHLPRHLPHHLPHHLPRHLPHQLPHSLLPHPLHLLLLRAHLKGSGVRSRGTRSALAPPTVTSLRPPDRNMSGQRSQGNISGNVGGSSGNINPPVVASQSPAVTNSPIHHNSHRNQQTHHHNSRNNHNNHHSSVSPVATASSRSPSRGGNQQQGANSHHGSVAWAEGEDGILIFGQESRHGEERTRGNRESERNLEPDESITVNGDSSSHAGELSGNRREISWDEEGQNGGGGGAWMRRRGNERRETGRDPRAQDDIRSEDVDGGWATERRTGGRGERTESAQRNDTFGHVITEDLSHLSSRNSREHGDSPAQPTGGRRHQDTSTRHVWVLEKVPEEEEEEEEGDEDEKEGMTTLDTIPTFPLSREFLNAYRNALEHTNDSRPREGGHSYPSSSSSPSSSHPSFTGSSSYLSHSSSPSSSHPSFTGSSAYPSRSTYSSSSNLQDDLSPFHQSIIPQPRPVNEPDDEYEPEDYINYHEYDQRGRNAFPQEDRRHSDATSDQHGNIATHNNRHQTLDIREIVRLKGLRTLDELMLLLQRKGITYQKLLELVNRGATEGEVLAFLNRPDVHGSDNTNHYPRDDTEDEMESEGELNDDDVAGERHQQRRRKKNRNKGRRGRGRNGKNRRGRNKGRRRGRIEQNQMTTSEPPLPLPAATATITDPTSFIPTSINPLSALPTTHPLHPHPPTVDTKATLLPTTLSTIPTVPSIMQNSTFEYPASIPEDPTGKTARVSEITVTVMKNADEIEQESEVTFVEDLRPARRRPNLQGHVPKDQFNRRHGGETRPREGIHDRGGVGVRDPGLTVAERPNGDANLSREHQEQYQFPVKGIMIISGLMGALAVFTLVVLISYAVIKCSKKPAVNNYQVSEQKNAIAS